MPDQAHPEEYLLTYRLFGTADAKGHPAYEKIQHLLGNEGYVVGDFKQSSENGATTMTVLLRRQKSASGHPGS